MKKLTLKGLDPKMLIKYVKKSALLSVKKDSIISDILPLYIYSDRVICIKQDGSGSTFKMWQIPLNEFCENHEEIKEKLTDKHCRVAVFSCKQFVVNGLNYFKEKINIELILNDEGSSFDAVNVLTIFNNKAKFRFSVTEASHAFKKIQGGWEFVDEFFSTENDKILTNFVISSSELKRVIELTKLENIVDKKHEFVTFSTKEGFIVASSHSADIKLHESDISLDEIMIKNDVVRTVCEEEHNVFVKKINNLPFIIFKSVETLTTQSIALLTAFNTNLDLDTVEDEIASIDFSEWDGQNEDALF